MPIRSTRPRKNTGLLHHLEPLFTRSVLKYIAWGQEYRLLSVLIFGPHFGLTHSEYNAYNRKITPECESQLRELWAELRAPILAAQQQYAPDRQPWGTKYDQ